MRSRDDPILKRWWIDKDKREAARKEDKESKGNGDVKSVLLPLISALVNHPGFKYNVEQLKDVGICQFYDSVQRLNIYEQSIACMHGMYSGFVDGSKIKPEAYDWMKDTADINTAA